MVAGTKTITTANMSAYCVNSFLNFFFLASSAFKKAWRFLRASAVLACISFQRSMRCVASKTCLMAALDCLSCSSAITIFIASASVKLLLFLARCRSNSLEPRRAITEPRLSIFEAAPAAISSALHAAVTAATASKITC